MSTFSGPEIPNSGLVFCIDAGNAKSYSGSGTAWNDVSGNSTNLTLTNGPTFNAANGGSFLFTSSANTYATSPDTTAMNFTAPMTLQAFFYINTYVNWAGIIGRNSGSTAGYGLNLSPNSQRLRFNEMNTVANTESGSWARNVETASTINIGEWIHGAATYDGSTVKMYLNGEIDNTQALASTPPIANTYFIQVGFDNPGGDEYFDGKIANISVFNRVLTDEEIRQSFRALRGRYGL